MSLAFYIFLIYLSCFTIQTHARVVFISPDVTTSYIDPPSIPTLVEVRMELFDIGKIDSFAPSIDIHIRVQLQWVDERVRQYANQTSYAITNQQVWVPLTDFENFDYASRRSATQVTEVFSFDDTTNVVTEFVVLRGYFSQTYSFKHFPFDKQSINIFLRTPTPDVVWLAPDDRFDINPEKYSIVDYSFEDHGSMEVQHQVLTEFGVTRLQNIWRARFIATRKWNQIVAVRVIPGIISVLVSLSQLYVDIKYFSSRISIAVFSLLVLISIQGVSEQYIPSTDKLSYVEIFILSNFILMFFSVVEVVWAQYLEKRHFKNTRRFMDYSSRIIFPLVFIDLNVGLLIYYAAGSTNGTIIWYIVASFVFSLIYLAYAVLCIIRLRIRIRKEKEKEKDGNDATAK